MLFLRVCSASTHVVPSPTAVGVFADRFASAHPCMAALFQIASPAGLLSVVRLQQATSPTQAASRPDARPPCCRSPPPVPSVSWPLDAFPTAGPGSSCPSSLPKSPRSTRLDCTLVLPTEGRLQLDAHEPWCPICCLASTADSRCRPACMWCSQLKAACSLTHMCHGTPSAGLLSCFPTRVSPLLARCLPGCLLPRVRLSSCCSVGLLAAAPCVALPASASFTASEMRHIIWYAIFSAHI